MAAQCIDMFYVDCKDVDHDIYHRYTGKDNFQMLDNLAELLSVLGTERVTVRLPLIPD